MHIQIQPMLRLNKVEAGETLTITKNSNTTNVKVKHRQLTIIPAPHGNSNTTNVKVKPRYN